MKKKWIQLGFVCLMGGLLGIFLLLSLVGPKDIVAYENRKAVQFPALSAEAVLSGDYQDTVEEAFADQIPLSELYKITYTKATGISSGLVLQQFYQADPEGFYDFNGYLVHGGDVLMSYPKVLTQERMETLTHRADSINALAKEDADRSYYLYYIKKDQDIDFQTGEDTGFWDFLRSKLDPSITTDCYELSGFEEYREKFYRTDHHWNHYGSYLAYLEVLELLEVREAPIAKGEAFLAGQKFAGSCAVQARVYDIWYEDLYAYRFAFPDMEVTLNGAPAKDYGRQNQPLEGPASYSSYFGGDDGEIVFDLHAPEKENLLILGESYDNAILKLLASHFNKTYSVDLRNYEHYMGQPFDYEAYVREHDIDKVLFIGNSGFFTEESFQIEVGK